MVYRNRRNYYGPGYGPGQGYGRGYGRGSARGYGPGRRWLSPNCDLYPDRPRGWLAIPEFDSPPEGAVYDTYGQPTNQDAIEYEISMIEKTIESLSKEIIKLKSLKENNN